MNSKLYIEGRWIEASARDAIPNLNPATDEVIGGIPVATEDDVSRAAESAGKGFDQWSQFTPDARANILMKVAQLLRERRLDLARTLTCEQGKVLSESLVEIDVSAAIFEWYAAEARRLYGRLIPPSQPGMELKVTVEPVGPVAIFTPWNFPMIEPAAHAAAALAAGCSIVIKVAEDTPLTGVALIEAMIDAGVPPLAVNLLTGNPGQIASRLIAAPQIRKVSLTGSVAVGKLLAGQAGSLLKTSTMELGGNAPVIVYDDVDVKATASLLAVRKSRNAGQVCTAGNRFYIHERIYDEFLDHYSKALGSLVVGHGLDAESQVGPLVNARRIAAMEEFVSNARATGAEIALGGHRIGEAGNFFANTIITNGRSDMLAGTQEVFGPISPLWKFSDTDAVIAASNDTDVGLAGYVFSKNLSLANYVSSRLKVGVVAVNHCTAMFVEAPFGGMKDSGFGHICGREGLDAYLKTKLTSVCYPS